MYALAKLNFTQNGVLLAPEAENEVIPQIDDTRNGQGTSAAEPVERKERKPMVTIFKQSAKRPKKNFQKNQKNFSPIQKIFDWITKLEFCWECRTKTKIYQKEISKDEIAGFTLITQLTCERETVI